MSSRAWLAYTTVIWVAFTWAIWNAFRAYLFPATGEAFRLETAVFILVGLLLPLAWMKPVPRPDQIDITSAQERTLLVAAAGVWLAIMLPLITMPFFSDDYGFLKLFQSVGDITRQWEFFRPAFATAVVILQRVGNGSPIAFHVASLALHFASAMILRSLTWRLSGSRYKAGLACVAFLLNPLQLEPVLWASGLQDLLWTFFLLGALQVYLSNALLSPWRIGTSALLVLLALFSKETAVCFVILIPAADFVLYRFNRGRLTPAAYACFGLALAIYLVVRQSSVVVGVPLVLPTRYFIKQFLSTPYRFFSQPWSDQVALPPGPVAFVIASVLLGLLVLAAVNGRAKALLVGPVIILAATLPLYAFFIVFSNLHNTRYLYFLAVGWSIFLAELFFRERSTRLLHLMTALTIVTVLAICSPETPSHGDPRAP